MIIFNSVVAVAFSPGRDYLRNREQDHCVRRVFLWMKADPIHIPRPAKPIREASRKTPPR
jgi:hypothetical protein